MAENQENSNQIASSKLVGLLSKLDRDETRQLTKFLSSPWFGANLGALKLFEALCPKGQLAVAGLTKYQLCQVLGLDVKALNKAMNALLAVVKKFLVQQELETDPALAERLLMRAANRRKAGSMFRTSAAFLLDEEGMAYLSKAPELHSDMLTRFQVRTSMYFHPQTDKFRPEVGLLSDTISTLDIYYFASKLFFACEVFNRKLFVDDKTEVPDIEYLIQYATHHYAEKNKAIRLYLDILTLLRNGRNDALFEDTRQFFFKNINQFGILQRQAVLSFMVNHANHLYKVGIAQYMPAIFRLYISAIKYDLIILNGEIAPNAFINISNTAALCMRYKFAKQFIQRAQVHLPADEKRATVEVALAFLHFHQGNFKEAYHHAYRSDLSSQRHALVAKPLMLRSSFEELLKSKYAPDTTSFLSNMNAFGKYIERNRTMNLDARTSFRHFINILHSLMLAVGNGYIASATKKRLRQRIKGKQPIFSRSWLAKKLEQIPEKDGEAQPKKLFKNSSYR